MILNKYLLYVFNFLNLIAILILLHSKYTFAVDDFYENKSYFGALLSGQIAKYNNDNEIAAIFYKYANKRDPENIDILELSLMSLILAGQVEKAVDTLKESKKTKTGNKTQIVKLLEFLSLIKEEKYKKALTSLENNNSLLIANRIKPIIKSWLTKDYLKARKVIDEFSNSSESEGLNDIKTKHLALINYYYKKKNEALSILKQSLNSDKIEKMRILYFYHKLDNSINKKDKLISSFMRENIDHSFNIYLKKKKYSWV